MTVSGDPSFTDNARHFNNPLTVKQHKCVSFAHLHFSKGKLRQMTLHSVCTGPAPKLSRTPGQLPDTIEDLHPGQHTVEILQEFGYQQQVHIL